MSQKKLDPRLRGVLTNPNEISDELLAELRSASTDIEAHRMFSHYADAACLPLARGFILDVVFGNHDAKTWRRGRILTAGWNLTAMLTTSTEGLLEPLGAIEAAETLLALPATRAAWEQGAHSVGAPAIARPDLDYRWKGGPHVVGVTQREGTPIANVELAVRRWIATRLAMVLHSKGRLFDATSAAEMIEGAGIEPGNATTSALGAAHGLLLELPQLRADPTLVPGFVGGDDTYME